MSSLGALSRRKGLKRGVLYVFCTFLPAFWSSQFPTSDSSAGRFLSAGSVFLSPRCGFGGGGGRKQEKFHLGGIVKAGEAASDRWGGLHQERLAKAAQAGGGLHHPQQGGFGDWGGVCCCFQHFYGTRLDCNTSVQLSLILSRIGTSLTGIINFSICNDTSAL